jgi:hypothetical protein
MHFFAIATFGLSKPVFFLSFSKDLLIKKRKNDQKSKGNRYFLEI